MYMNVKPFCFCSPRKIDGQFSEDHPNTCIVGLLWVCSRNSRPSECTAMHLLLLKIKQFFRRRTTKPVSIVLEINLNSATSENPVQLNETLFMDTICTFNKFVVLSPKFIGAKVYGPLYNCFVKNGSANSDAYIKYGEE